MKKKILIPLIAMVIVIAAVVVLLPNLFLKSSSKKQQKAEGVDPKEICADYYDGKISIDDFVKKSIDHPSEYVPIDLFICNNIDQLSESTLEYYLEQINLPNVTFDPDKENTDDKDSNLGLYAKPVYADEKIQNLEEVVLSSKGNFLVWYTTTGESAITKEQAENIASGLEEAIEEYKIRLGIEYKFECDYFSRGERFLDKKIIVHRNNISDKYLDSAMQIYVYEYSEDENKNTVAQYVSRMAKNIIGQRYHELKGSDNNDSIVAPYIRIRPSNLSDNERARQLLNHELFHHYQFEVLKGYSTPVTDMRILDATANWASALVTPKESLEGFLNEWAHTARKYADQLFSEEMINKYKSEGGEDRLSYALFVYLYHYSACVDDGLTKILDSIYQKDAFEYLYKSATLEELAKVQEEVAIKNFTQDYSNKNLIAAPSYHSFVPVRSILSQEILNGRETYSTDLTPFAMEVYRVQMSPAEAKLEKNYNIVAFLFKEQDGEYELIDKVSSDSNEYVFDLTEYENMYLVIANISLTSNNTYQLTITPAKKTDPEKTETGDTNTRPSDSDELTPVPQELPKGTSFLSYETTSHWNEEILKDIETYYFDENDMVCYRTVTLYIAEEEGLMDVFYQNVAQSPNLYTNIKVEGNMIQYDYTAYALELTHDDERSKETIIGLFEYPGGYVDDGYVRTDYNPHE